MQFAKSFALTPHGKSATLSRQTQKPSEFLAFATRSQADFPVAHLLQNDFITRGVTTKYINANEQKL